MAGSSNSPIKITRPDQATCSRRAHGNHHEVVREVPTGSGTVLRGYCRYCQRTWATLDEQLNGVGDERGRKK